MDIRHIEEDSAISAGKKGGDSILHKLISYCLLLLVPAFITFAASKAYGVTTEEAMRNIITAFIGSGMIIFLWIDTSIRKGFSYGNEKHMDRFFLIYCALSVFAVLLPIVHCTIWPYMCVFVVLSLFSSPMIGLCGGCMLLDISILFYEGDVVQAFVLYLIAGLVAVVLFQNVGAKLSFGLPIFISLLLLFVLLVGYDVLFLQGSFSVSMFALPVVNLVISTLILLVLLNAFSLYVIRGSSDMYMDINDPEFELLTRIKNKDKKEYYRAIHTAYLADHIADHLGLDRRAVKACAYYHKVGLLEGRPDDFECANIYFNKYQFPEKAVELLKEYIDGGSRQPVSKEATVLSLCEDLVCRIMTVFEKDKTAQLDSDRMINEMFERRNLSGSFTKSDLSISELGKVNKLLKKEKLYYDFLR